MPVKSPEPSKITLKFGGQKGTGAPAMSVDSEALKRQQDLVRAGANGHATATGSSTTSSLGQPSRERGASVSQVPNGLKAETSHGQSPALKSIQLNGSNETRQSPNLGSGQMPPPAGVSTRLPSGSPHPQSLTNGTGPTSTNPTTSFNSRIRQPGKGESSISSVLELY